jgi:crotonobetainyl-CoA:carnitine CoA-transferase CaiB-like acyl-CoA transferase
MTAVSAPLAGVRVLDLCAYAVGPWAGTLLAQLGADVTRIDPPYGDPIRNVMPAMRGEPTTYMCSNMGKRSAILNLKDAGDLEIARRLAAQADVVIENARAGTMDRLGLGYDQLRLVNPGLVYCASSSFGDVGPLRTMGSTDPQGQAFSGFASLNGAPGTDGEVLRYVALVDLASSMYLTQAVLIGLHARRRTGHGQFIRTSQMEASLAVQTTRLTSYLATGDVPEPLGSGSPTLVPSRVYRCQDAQWIAVTAPTDRAWRALCDFLDLDGRELGAEERLERRDEIDAALEAAFAARPALHWTQRLPRLGVACVRPRTLEDDIEHHAHFAANEMVARVPHPIAGTLRVAGPPWRFERSPALVRGPGLPGRETEAVIAGAPPASEPAPAAADGEQGAPLEGLRVLDVSEGIAGPYCTLLLRTLGAEVTKLEPPGGDWLRAAGAPARQLNRGKASIELDITTDAGHEALLRLVREADVLVHEWTAEGAPLTPEQLRAVNPRLIDCSVTPLGERGPWAGLPATELEVQALAGLHRYLGSVTEPLVRLGADVGGIIGGCAAVQAILAASYAGVGQHVAVSQLGALTAMANVMLAALDDPDAWEGFHCNAAMYPPDRGIATRDGRIYYGQPLRSEEAWQEFCRDIGADALLEDPRFLTRAQRMPNQMLLRRELEPYFLRLDTDDLVERVIRSDGIAVPINTYPDLVDHPQLEAVGVLADADGARTLAPPWRRRGAPLRAVTEPAPDVGADGPAVLGRAGFKESEIRELLAVEGGVRS